MYYRDIQILMAADVDDESIEDPLHVTDPPSGEEVDEDEDSDDDDDEDDSDESDEVDEIFEDKDEDDDEEGDF